MPGLQYVRGPIPHVGGADADVIDLAVVVAAFLARKDLEFLLARAARVDGFSRILAWHLLVAFAMHEQERAFHFLDHSVEPETLELPECFFPAFHAEHPLQMLRGNRQRNFLPAFYARKTLFPLGAVIPFGAPRDAARETMIHGRRARRVITAEAQSHDADALTIEFGPRGKEIIGSAGVPLGLVM